VVRIACSRIHSEFAVENHGLSFCHSRNLLRRLSALDDCGSFTTAEDELAAAFSTHSELLIRLTIFGGRGRFQIPSILLAAEFQIVTSLYGSVRRTGMLQVVAPYVAEMLYLKAFIINVVAGVAGFQSMLHLSHPIPWARMEDG
jgi:hypothetical protein